MTDDELIVAMRGRAAEDIPAATPDEIAQAEAQLGFPLFRLHRRLLMEVQNGGFGPGFHIIGTVSGYADHDTGSIVSGSTMLELPSPLVLLCNWGCGTWSCVDSQDGRVVTCDGTWGLTDIGQGLSGFLQDWLAHVDMWSRMYEYGEPFMGINPFTKKPYQYPPPAIRAIGTPYKPR